MTKRLQFFCLISIFLLIPIYIYTSESMKWKDSVCSLHYVFCVNVCNESFHREIVFIQVCLVTLFTKLGKFEHLSSVKVLNCL